MYSVVYRSGHPHHCRWTRVLESYATAQDATEAVRALERMGYKALAYLTSHLDAFGLPIGWDGDSVVDWDGVRIVNHDGIPMQTVYRAKATA
jgi:hypothetical protein